MENRRSKFQPYITLGNILTLLTVLGSGFAFFLKYNDRLLLVEASQIAEVRGDGEFRREVLQKLQDLQTDVREIRSQAGVRWRELPPSPYRR